MTNLTIRATTTDAELDAIQYLDMRREAIQYRDAARAVFSEQGDQPVLEYVEYSDGVAVLYSELFGYAYVNQHSPGVGDSLVINAGDASSAEAAADIYRTRTSPTLYTVARSDGENREYNLTLADAARMILQHDGGDFEIRPHYPYDDGFSLWVRQQVANIQWTLTGVSSFEETADAAETDIFKQVVDKSGCDGWRGLVAEDQSSYRAMLERMRAFGGYDPVEDADVIAEIDAELAEISP